MKRFAPRPRDGRNDIVHGQIYVSGHAVDAELFWHNPECGKDVFILRVGNEDWDYYNVDPRNAEKQIFPKNHKCGYCGGPSRGFGKCRCSSQRRTKSWWGGLKT